MAKSNFIVRGGADFSGIQQEISKTEKSLKGFESRINSTFKGISEGLGINLGKLTKIGLIAAATKKLVDFGKEAIEVASDLTEVQNVVDVTFGPMAADINEFASNAIKQFGLSELSAKQFASTMGAMLKSSGITGEAVKDMSIELTKLAADMASFYNLDPEEAFTKIRAGISGETEPLKQLGINMNIANLEAFALSQGINKAWKEMTQAEQTMLRYNYLLSVTSDAQGDFARNAGTWANQVKLLREQWQEFLGLIGKVLVEILLPVVKFLNKALGVIIEITKAIGKIYTMITGREVTVGSTISNSMEDGLDSTNDFTDGLEDLKGAAGGAGKGQKDLADGVGKAAKAAKKALAPFDELNILQKNLASGVGGKGASGGSGGIGGLENLFLSKSEITTTIDTRQVDSGIEGMKSKWDDFIGWIINKWNALKGLLSIPVYVPAPIFAPIPDPIYKPNWGFDIPPMPAPVFPPIPSPVYNPDWGFDIPPMPAPVFPPIPSPVYNPDWGLDVPGIPAPVFQPIPNPVYQPNWGLEIPKIPPPVFPPIPSPVYEPVWNLVPPPVPAADYREYSKSLETMKTETSNIFNTIKTNVSKEVINLQNELSKTWEDIRKDTETVTGRIMEGLKKAWDTVETNFNTHKNNVGIIATGIATTLVTNINSGLTTMGSNVNRTIETVQNNLQTFGRNVATVGAETAKGFVSNLNEGFKTTASNFATFANSVGQNLKAFGSGFLKAAAETAKGFVSNMVSGFATVWNNFKNLMSGIGEKIKGWFSANKSVITKTAIAAGIAVGVGALALTMPQAIPFVAGSLGRLATIPALAEGGITNGPTLAMVGDNVGGKEVISPLDGLLDMITEAVSTTNNGGDIYLTVKLGEDTITEKVISNINRQNRINGKTVIKV